MHICFLCNEYPPGRHGGIGTFTQTLGRDLVERGHQVSVVGIYADRNGIENDCGVQVIGIPSSPVPRTGLLINGLRIRRCLATLNKRQPIDFLEGPENSLAMISTSVSYRRLIRMNGGHHFFAATLGQTPKRWRSFIERRSFRNATHFAAVSRFVAETTQQLLHLGNVPVSILPNPVNINRFTPLEGSTEKPNSILFVGTVCEKKGVRQLIQAMPMILNIIHDARLVIVGREWYDPQTRGSYTESLRKTIPEELRGLIEFRGRAENADLPRFFSDAAVAVFPSHMEAQGIVALEAMAMQKAVVFSETGPGKEIIEHGVSGLLCNPHDPTSIAEQVILALKNDTLRQHMGIAARSRVLQEFSSSIMVEKNEAFYQKNRKR